MNWYRGKREIARAIHLDLTHAQERYAAALLMSVRRGDRWLDVGCEHSIIPEWAMSRDDQVRLVRRAAFLVGVDIDDGIDRHPLLTYRIKALCGALPFKDATFDLITANMVIEHIADPDEFLRDIFRVLRPCGRFLFVTPNCLTPMLVASRMVPDPIKKHIVHFLEKRHIAEIFPTRYRMNTPKTVEHYAEKTGFKVEKLNLIGSNGMFDRMGPISWIECLMLKAMQDSLHGKLQPDILAELTRKPAA